MKTPPVLINKQEWEMPVLEIISSENTEADPTPGDDGLGDGSFK